VTLHLVRIGVNPRALAAFAVARRVADDDDGYALHCALIARFGTAAAPRPFRYLPDHPRGAHLLGYVTDATALAEAAALPLADDLPGDVFGPPAARAMPDTWRTGARYGFEVRVRPVTRFGKRVRAECSAREDAWQRGAGEVDAHVAACDRAAAAGDDPGGVDRETVYVEWLARRLAGAALLETAGLRLFRRSRTRRNTHVAEGARTRLVEGPDAVMAGTLAVDDPAAFARVIADGLGRHAAFGYGMVLLAPAGL